MNCNILALGEVLWDLLPAGKQLGGPPTNFAFHCRSLGARARLITRVGDDALGRQILERFQLLDLPTEIVQVAAFVCSQPGGMPVLPEALKNPAADRAS